MKQNKTAEITLSEKIYNYDDVNKGFKSYVNVRKPYLDLLGISSLKGMLILDAGCGTGMDGVILSMLGNKVVGVDISSKATKLAMKRAKKEGADLQPIIGDLESLPFRNESFDACFVGWTLHHFPEIQYVIQEFARVLKPNGRIYIIEPNGSSLPVKMSKIFERIFRRLIIKSYVDTPNETLHTYIYYLKSLKKCGFSDVKVNSCYFGGVPPLPKPSNKIFSRLQFGIFYLLLYIRRITYLFLVKITSRPLNGVDLLITAILRKPRSLLYKALQESGYVP
jgi:ubiquinone/menaquinone biosynthesis C-methylase UbiE